MSPYIALIRKGGDTDFGVDFPDFPGCITAGRTLDEALAMAREALALHIKGMTADGEAIPAPSSLEVITSDPANADGVAVLVEAPAPRPVIERVNVTLDQRLLQEIDARANAEGMTRSGFIAHAARRILQGPNPPVGLPKLGREKPATRPLAKTALTGAAARSAPAARMVTKAAASRSQRPKRRARKA